MAIVTAIVTASLVTTIAIVTVTHFLVYDCVHTEAPTVTLTRVVTVARSERVFFFDYDYRDFTTGS